MCIYITVYIYFNATLSVHTILSSTGGSTNPFSTSVRLHS